MKLLNQSGDCLKNIDFFVTLQASPSSSSTSELESLEVLSINTDQQEEKALEKSIDAETQTDDREPELTDAETQTSEQESKPSMSDEFTDAETQTKEFEYMFSQATYQAPDREYFKSDDKVRFYTGLPSYEVLMVVFKHVFPQVSRRSLNLDSFQEFFMVLMKLRLNVPFQDLAYRFMISL